MSASRTLLNKQGRRQGPVSRARYEIPVSRSVRMSGKAPALVERAIQIAKGFGRTAQRLKREQEYQERIKAAAQEQAHQYGGTPA